MNATKFPKLTVETKFTDIFIFNKEILKRMSFRNVLENGMQDKNLISLLQLWLYFANITKTTSNFAPS